MIISYLKILRKFKNHSDDYKYPKFIMKKIILPLSILCSFMLSCSNSVDYKISKEWNKCKEESNCIIDFANVMNFEWDTMCYYSVANSLEDINEDLGFKLNKYKYTGDRLIFLNKGRFVYQYEFSYLPSKSPEGVFILTDLDKFRVSKSDAKFKVEKVDKAYYLEKL